MLLLIGARLLVRSFQNLRTVDTGFDRQNLVQFSIDPGARLEVVRRLAVYKEALDRLEALPGSRSASLLTVKDAKYQNLRDPSPKTFYSSYFQRPNNIDHTFQLRTYDFLACLLCCWRASASTALCLTPYRPEPTRLGSGWPLARGEVMWCG